MKTLNATKGTVNDYYEPGAGWNVGDEFKVARQTFLLVTDEQGTSFERVVLHQGRENYKGAYIDLYNGGMLGVDFNHIFIGIEPDGYAHS